MGALKYWDSTTSSWQYASIGQQGPQGPPGVDGVAGPGGADLAWVAATSTVTSHSGTDATLTVADATNPGLMSVAHRNKVEAISTFGATLIDDTSAAEALATLGAAPIRRTIKADVTTAYSPVLTDENQMVTLSNASPITVTMPQDSAVAFPVGAEIDFVWLGAGQPNFVAGTGATVVSTPGLKLRAQYSAATAKKISTNDWLIIGDLSA